jgi:glycosyltransferase involved in cell wall biosynthesis
MVEILLSTYNGSQYLSDQIESILNQTYSNWSLLIRDDGSTDESMHIIGKYTLRYPSQIRILDDDVKHRGASSSFSELLAASSAEYIMFCDQDDIWNSTKIEKTLNSIKRIEAQSPNCPVLVFTDLVKVDHNLNQLAASFIRDQKLYTDIISNVNKLIALNVATGCTIMINKIAKQYVVPFPSKIIVHDHWLIINIAYYGKVFFLNEATILYRQHNNNLIGSNYIDIQYFLKKVLNINIQFSKLNILQKRLKFKINIPKMLLYKLLFTIKRLVSN